MDCLSGLFVNLNFVNYFNQHISPILEQFLSLRITDIYMIMQKENELKLLTEYLIKKYNKWYIIMHIF